MTDEWDRQDPRDANVLALTTRLGKMETVKQSCTSGEGKTSSGATDEDDETIKGTTIVKKWRAVKKAASVTSADKTWYWCPKHVLLGKFDGLYVTHKPENHVDYKNEKEHGQRDKEKTNREEKGAPKDNLNP